MPMLKGKPGKRATRGGSKPTHPKRLIATQKAIKAVELRIAGIPYRLIAATIGYNSPQACQAAVIRLLQDTAREPTDDLRNMELDRLDSLFRSTYPLAKQGVLTAVDRCLKIMERRARLLGLDQPVQVELAGPGGAPIQVREVVIEVEGTQE